jgi:hypothetical protein
MLAAPATSSGTVGATLDPIRTWLRNITFPVTSNGTLGDAVATPTFPTVVKVELTFTSPVTSSAADGATLDPILTWLLNIAFPVTSNGTLGDAVLIPTHPVVISAVPGAAVDIISAAATDAAPETSNLTPGVIVPIPTFPAAFTNIRSTPAVLIRTELENLAPDAVSVFTPIKSIQEFAGVCAVNLKNPVLFAVFTPRISFAVLGVVCIAVGISELGLIALDINLMRGLSV